MPLVLLIHGTWPNGPFRRVRPEEPANWFHPESALARRLGEGPGAETVVEPFHWSGANTTGARSRAAWELACRLAGDERARDGVALVAHSHGGTVVMETLYRHDAMLRRAGVRIDAAICLASPFVYVTELSDAQREDSLDVALAIGCLLILLAVLNFAPAVLAWPWYGLGAAALVTSLLLYVALGLASQWATPGLWAADECLPPPPPKLPPIDVVRAPGDEASGLIGFTGFLKWLVVRSYVSTFRSGTNWQELKRDLLRPGNAARRFVGYALATLLWMYLLARHSQVARSIPLENLFIAATFCHEALVALPTLAAYASYAAACGFFRPRRFGWVGIEMEPTPPGVAATVHLLPPQVATAGLAHALHSWPDVQDYVARLVQMRVRDAARGGSGQAGA